MIERLIDDAIENEYFKELYDKIIKNFALHTLRCKIKDHLTEKEFRDILKFADIISQSRREENRNLAYRIICLLKLKYEQSEVYVIYANAILKTLGNFPALAKTEEIALPVDRQIDFMLQKIEYKVPFAKEYFTPAQYKLYQIMNNSQCFSFSGPTSMGKTFVVRKFILEKIMKRKNENFCIIVPTRALLKQYVLEFSKDMKDNKVCNEYRIVTNANILDMIECTEDNFIFVLTPERLLNLIYRKDRVNIDYLIIDEAHKVFTEDERGLTYYTSIDSFITIYSSTRIIFATPHVNNPEIFNETYKCNNLKIAKIDESPVAQNIFFMDMNTKQVEFIDRDVYKFNFNKIDYINDVSEIIYRVGNQDHNIIYCNSSNAVMEEANKLAKYIVERGTKIDEDDEGHIEIEKLCSVIEKTIHKEYYLIDCLRHRIGYHFGRLPNNIREGVEELFKKGIIKYLFCTSTLLEGVNLPAKNIFVLSDYIGRKKMKAIDFWNLAGRAGRLGQEYYGNVICIKRIDRKREWKDEAILKSKDKIQLVEPLSKYIKKEKDNIKDIISDEDLHENLDNKAIYKNYLANIIQIDYLTNKDNKLIESVGEISGCIINECEQIANKVDKEILNTSKSIDIKVQNYIFDNIFIEEFPNEINKNICKFILDNMYEKYDWKIKEKRLSNKKKMNYIAGVMSTWINDTPLSSIIAYSLRYHKDNGVKVKLNFNEYVVFNPTSKEHINIVINDVISDIENIMKFDLEKYFNHYYQLICNRYGKNNVGVNWSIYLEYGTRNTNKIILQNIGFSRYTSNVLVNEFSKYLKFEDGRLVYFDKDIIKSRNMNNEIVLREIHRVLGYNIVE